MKRTTRLISNILIISLLIATLTSCGNLFTKVPYVPDQPSTGTIRGFIQTGSEGRSAFPKADFDSTEIYDYFVVATDSEGTKINGEFENTRFTLSDLVFGTEYTISASVVRKADRDTVLEGTFPETITLTKDAPNRDGIRIDALPLTKGTGSIALTVSAQAAGPDMPELTKVVASLEEKAGENFTSTKTIQFTSDADGQTATISFQGIPSGGRRLTLNFYKDVNGEDDLVYQCYEAVNVIVNMTTDQWVKVGEERWLSTETTSFYLDEDLVKIFETSSVCVDTNSTEPEETGSPYNPFTTLAAALERLSSVAEEKHIYVKNGSSLTYDASITLGNNLIIEAYTSKRGDYTTSETKPSFDLSTESGYSFTVPTGKKLTVSGMKITWNSGSSRFFDIATGAEAAFTNCTFSDGSASNGGAINNKGTASFNSCTFSGNSSNPEEGFGKGGAIYNTGTITLAGSMFSGNSANNGNGGAVYNGGTATLSVTGCTFSGNTTGSGNGGAIYNEGTVTLAGCTFKNNSANNGGALYNDGTVNFPVNSSVTSSGSFEGNSAEAGGAIYNKKTMTFKNVTFNNNKLNNGDKSSIYSTSETEDTAPLITFEGDGNTNDGDISLYGTSKIKIETAQTAQSLGTLDLYSHSNKENARQFLTTGSVLDEDAATAQGYFSTIILGEYHGTPVNGYLTVYPEDAIYVDSNRTGSGNTGTYKNPYTTIYAALDAVNGQSGTDTVTVFVKSGTEDESWNSSITLSRSTVIKVYASTPANADTETGTATIYPAGNYAFTIGTSTTGADSISFSATGLIFNGSHTDTNGTIEFVDVEPNVSEAVFTNCSFKNYLGKTMAGAFITYAPVTFDNCVFKDNKLKNVDQDGKAIDIYQGGVATLKGSTWFGENDVIRLLKNDNDTAQFGKIKVEEELTLNENANKSWKLDASDIVDDSQILTGEHFADIRDFFTLSGKYIDDNGKLKTGCQFYVNPDFAGSFSNGTNSFPFTTLTDALSADDFSDNGNIKILKGSTTSITSATTGLPKNLTLSSYTTDGTAGTATINVSDGAAFTVSGTGGNAGSVTAANIAFVRTAGSGPIFDIQGDATASFTDCSFTDNTVTSDYAVAINGGKHLTLSGAISLGNHLQIKAEDAEGAITLGSSFKTVENSIIPLTFDSIEAFTGDDSNVSPFASGTTSAQVSKFKLTGRDGYAFDSTGHIVRPGAGGAINLPEIKYETGLTISCTPDSDGWTFTVKKGDSPIEISDPKCLVTFWGDYLYIFNDGIPYNKETNSYNVKITDSLPPGNYGITFTFTYNEYSYSSSGFSIRDDKYKSFDQVYSPTFYETVTGE